MRTSIGFVLLTLPALVGPVFAAADPSPVYAYQDNATSASSQEPPSDSSVLPFLGDAARARGYQLPEPFGVNINYMNMRQNINVQSINFNGLALNHIPLDNAFDIAVGKTRESSETETVKLDAWLLPFMDIYGLIGHTEGHSMSKIGVGLKGRHGKIIHPDALQNLDFRLDFKGTTYGVGTTLVGGIGNWFTAVDTNFTQTKFDILDGSIDAFTLSPRVGYRFTTPGVPAINLPSGKLNVWVGSMYQNVQQEFKGSLNDLNMPTAELQKLVNFANQEGNGRFDVKQQLQSPWNMLLGTQYEVTRNFNILTEVGFAKRNSLFIASEYRF
ncbi:hypothetical protein [Atlantibacter sp.]|uniref:hypothetical protein n=1 Tax=Atlantibacter sp. TaxID=1903473 RepID=UPI0013EF621F|nr:hypothetical protein [Atlantibacter sp.]EJP4075642.1 hypothetical protein [Escherichia coli]